MDYTRAAPLLTDAPVEGAASSIDAELESRAKNTPITTVPVQDVNKMALAVNAASAGTVTYDDAYKSILVEGPTPQTVRQLAATIYTNERQENVTGFNQAASQGVVVGAELYARQIESLDAAVAAGISDRKAISTVTKEASLNAALSNPTTVSVNTTEKLASATDDAGRNAAIQETLEQHLAKQGAQPSLKETVAVMGGVLGIPIAAGLATTSPGVALLTSLPISAKFFYDSHVQIPKAIEEVLGIKSEGNPARQILASREMLKTLSPDQQQAAFEAIADRLVENEVFGKNTVGKVFAAFNVLRLTDSYEDGIFNLQVQDWLDRVGLGAEAISVLQIMRRASGTASTIAHSGGGKQLGRMVGEDIVKGSSKVEMSGAEQTGMGLSFDLSKYRPDGIADASPEVQKALNDSLTKVLKTLDGHMSIADDAEALKVRDFVQKNAQGGDMSVVAYNNMTGELVVQHPSGSTFHTAGVASAYAEELSKTSGLKWEVVAADNVTTVRPLISIDEVDDFIPATSYARIKIENPQLEAVVREGASVQEALEAVSSGTNKVHLKDLADRMLANPALNLHSVQITDITDFEKMSAGTKVAGLYRYLADTIGVNKAKQVVGEATLMHEVVHAVTGQIIDAVKLSGKRVGKVLISDKHITGAQKQAVKSLDHLYKALSSTEMKLAFMDGKHTPDEITSLGLDVARMQEHKDYAKYYGFTNVHEMIAEATTNKDFARVLKNVPLKRIVKNEMWFDSLTQNVWDALVSTWHKLLGVKSGAEVSALDSIIQNTMTLVDSATEGQRTYLKGLADLGLLAEKDFTAIRGASALTHGYYVRRAGATRLAHDAKDIESRWGGLDPIHMASERSVHDRTFQLLQEQRDRRGLAEFLDAGFKGLSRKQHKKVVQTLEDGNDLTKEFNAAELVARGLGDKEQLAYYTYRTLSNLDLDMKNIEINKGLSREGYVSSTYFNVGGVGMSSPARTRNAADVQGRMAFNVITGRTERIDAAALTSNIVVETKKALNVGGAGDYTLFIGDTTKFAWGQTQHQIPKLPGSYRRIYTDDYFGRVITNRTVNGEIVQDPLHLRTSKSGADMRGWTKGMQSILDALKNNPAAVTHAFVESKVGKWENTGEVMTAIGRGDWANYVKFEDKYDRQLESYLTSLTKALWDDTDLDRSRGIRLTSIDKNKDNILDPMQAIQAEYTNVARLRGMNEWKDKWVETWWNDFAHLIPEDVKIKYKTPLEAISAPEMQTSIYIGGDKAAKFAESQRRYILQQLGMESLDEKVLKNAMIRFTDSLSADNKVLGAPVGDALVTAGHLLRKADPLQFIRSFNFFTMLAGFNPAQLIVQSAGAANAIAISPIHGMKAAFTAPLLRVALASDNPAVWKMVATLEKGATLGLANADEFVEVVKAIKRVGLIDGIVATSMHSAEAGAYNMLTGAVASLGTKTAMFFNRGEEFSRLTAFEVARREWISSNPGGMWNNADALRHIVSRADDFTQNMTKSNLAFYQRGVLSIPGQFLQYNIKLANNLAGAGAAWTKAIGTGAPPVYRGFTVGEAGRIAAFHILAYGMVGNGLMGMADEVVGGYEKLIGRPATDDEKLGFSQGLLASLINELSQATTGEDLKLGIGKRLGVAEYYVDLATSIRKADSSFWEVVLGPSYGSAQRLGSLRALVEPFKRHDYSVDAFAASIAAVGKETLTTWRNGSKAYYAQLHDGLVVNKQGIPVVKLTTPEIIAQALGIGSATEVENWRLVTSRNDRNAAVKDFAKEWVRVQGIMLDVLKNNPTDERLKSLNVYSATLHSKLPPAEWNMFWEEVKKGEKMKGAAEPWKDNHTKMRAEYLQGSWQITDQLTSRSYGMKDQLPLKMEQ